LQQRGEFPHLEYLRAQQQQQQPVGRNKRRKA